MSYALRNTIILLVTLFLFVGAGLGFTKFYQQGRIVDLAAELEVQNQDLTSKQQIRDQYPSLLNRYNTAREIVLGYDKTLFPSNDPDDVYNYLSEIQGEELEIYYDFILEDSTQQGQYGIINSNITGLGVYSDFVTFVNQLENSELLNKISEISVLPGNNIEDLEYVDFAFKLQSYYQRESFEAQNSGIDPIRMNQNISVFNPFKPLILNDIPPNTDNLIDVQTSRLLGLTGSRVFIVDNTGKRHSLKIGDKVYLGYLETINTQEREAVFSLDKGGINEFFTLKVIR